MTSGEKINYYRKQLGLSQEELGQKLLVSRQTISLWEKGQTVPTIDNLIRLKEIFGVSVDEILGVREESVVEAELSTPRESYEFQYSRDEYKRIVKLSNNGLLKKIISVIVVSVLCAISGVVYEPMSKASAFIFGVTFSALIFVVTVLRENNKRTIKISEKIERNTYSVKVFDDYFNVNISRNNEDASVHKFYFSDIEQILEIENYLFVIVFGLTFIFRKSELSANSIFYSYIYKNPKKVIGLKINNVWSVVLLVLFLLSLASFVLAELIIFALPEATWQQNCWPFYAVIPIPALSVIFGIIFKIKGYKCIKNIVVGLLMTVILIAFGSAPYMEEDLADHTDAAIVNAEQVIGIEIPEAEGVNTYYWAEDEQYNEREYMCAETDAWFTEATASAFEKELAEDDKWLSQAPTTLLALVTENAIYYDYMLVYNVDTDELNTLPEESGIYRLLFVGYHSESDSIRICEYDLKYIVK